MFEEVLDNGEDQYLPPKPAVIILDINLVTGIDVSAIDVLQDIANLCKVNNCSMLISGASTRIRKELVLRGVGSTKSFFFALEPALGAAEDFILREVFGFEENEKSRVDRRMRLLSEDTQVTNNEDNGFLHALKQIDEQVSILLYCITYKNNMYLTTELSFLTN